MLKEKIFNVFDEVIDELRSEMEVRNKVASGNTLRSFELKANAEGYELVQDLYEAAPLFVLQDGREPGAIPFGFTEILERWSEDKGITFSSERERHSFAYLLGKRIKERGIEASPTEWISEILSRVDLKIEDIVYTWALEELDFK